MRNLLEERSYIRVRPGQEGWIVISSTIAFFGSVSFLVFDYAVTKDGHIATDVDKNILRIFALVTLVTTLISSIRLFPTMFNSNHYATHAYPKSGQIFKILNSEKLEMENKDNQKFNFIVYELVDAKAVSSFCIDEEKINFLEVGKNHFIDSEGKLMILSDEPKSDS